MGWIRRWIGKHWCRDLAELRDQSRRAAEDRSQLEGQIRDLRGQIVARDAKVLEVTEHNTRCLGEMAEAHKKLLAEDLGRDLARIVAMHGAVGSGLDALAGRMGLGVGEQCPLPPTPEGSLPDGVAIRSGEMGLRCSPCLRGEFLAVVRIDDIRARAGQPVSMSIGLGERDCELLYRGLAERLRLDKTRQMDEPIVPGPPG